MARDKDFDLAIIGAGSAAFAGAIRAVESGHRVAMIEQATLGGTCVNVGCVPSKALLRPGELSWSANHHRFSGLSTTSATVDLALLVAQKDELVSGLRQAKYFDLVGEYGFEVIPGHGCFVSPETIEVNGEPLNAKKYLIATGAFPGVPPISGLAETGYLTSTTALETKEVPRRLVVIGANAIGLELGQFFIHVGSSVTFVDVANRIAPFEEPEISKELADLLTEQGASIHTKAQVLGVHRARNHIDVSIRVDNQDIVLVADEILIATGRRPNSEGLGLENAGVKTDGRGAIQVDALLQSANPQIYAAGDVTGAPQFVYVSAYEGVLAVDNALNSLSRTVDFTGLPRVTFTSPQVASAGLTQAQAIEAGFQVETSVLPLDAVPRALVNRDTRGLIKLVAEQGTGRLLGASVMAEGAGEVIQSAVLAIRNNISVSELASTFHPYLTMVEGLKLAAQGFSKDIHKLSCCAA